MHIMLDIETLGLSPLTAPIIQIAAEPFRLFDDGPSNEVAPFRALVVAASNLVPPFNREILPDTVAWWAKTDPRHAGRNHGGQGGQPRRGAR